MAGPTGATVELDWADWAYPEWGPNSSVRINTVNNADRYFADLRFTLHNTQEFNGNLQQAQLHFYLKANAGSNFISGHDLHLTLYDAAGRYADMEIPTNVGVWDHFDINLGQGTTGWREIQQGFDWKYIKEIAFRRWGFLNDYLKVDQLYFSWYQFVPALLYINSEPSGYRFSYDSVISKTNTYIQVAPNTPTQIGMDPQNFIKWEDQSTTSVRTITLAEGETKTITAYYSTPAPNGGNGGDNMLLLAGGAIVAVGLLYLLSRGFK